MGRVVFLGIALLIGGCSSEQTLPTGSYVLPAELTIDAHSLRGPEGELSIVGTTNFPDGMKMWIHVGAKKIIASDDGVRVHNGKFETIALWERVPNPYFSSKLAKLPDGPKLKFRNRPIPSGSYRVQFLAYFSSGVWQTPDVVRMLGGEGGKNLRGKMFTALSPDVIDSSKKMDYWIMVEVPELKPEAKAISLVKAAVLSVPGFGRSATDVEANIDFFTSVTSHLPDGGIRPTKRWGAQKGTNGSTYEVTFDYIDRKTAMQAIWSADLRTGTIKYVNEHAKNFSWTPDY